MASVLVGKAGGAELGDRLLACVAGQGSAAHPYLRSEALLRGPDASRNLSDAVHFLCMLHGRHPGVVDHAADRCLDTPGRNWFPQATADFARERAFLARLAVAAGPIPSTPGAGGSEAAVLSQRHAIDMLARSERSGCALGAALAVVLDWQAIRLVLDAAGRRFGTDAPRPPADAFESVAAFLAAADLTPGMERALMFGAEQIVLQHSGLWDLLEVRQQARALA
jgi:hypothetical protein